MRLRVFGTYPQCVRPIAWSEDADGRSHFFLRYHGLHVTCGGTSRKTVVPVPTPILRLTVGSLKKWLTAQSAAETLSKLQDQRTRFLGPYDGSLLGSLTIFSTHPDVGVNPINDHQNLPCHEEQGEPGRARNKHAN